MMSPPTRHLIAGVVVTVAAVLLLGRSGTVGAQVAHEPSAWVKIGRYHFNSNHIKYTTDYDQDLVIEFESAGTSRDRITLKGAEAEAMRSWLEVRSADPIGAAKATPPPPAPSGRTSAPPK